MEKYTIIISVIILYFCFLSCNQHVKGQVNTIVIQYDKITQRDFDIGGVEYIPLETTEESLIGEMSKILYKNSRYYILDKYQSKGVYIFDRNGKYISSIKKQREGHGEYIEMVDMDVDANNNI